MKFSVFLILGVLSFSFCSFASDTNQLNQAQLYIAHYPITHTNFINDFGAEQIALWQKRIKTNMLNQYPILKALSDEQFYKLFIFNFVPQKELRAIEVFFQKSLSGYKSSALFESVQGVGLIKKQIDPNSSYATLSILPEKNSTPPPLYKLLNWGPLSQDTLLAAIAIITAMIDHLDFKAVLSEEQLQSILSDLHPSVVHQFALAKLEKSDQKVPSEEIQKILDSAKEELKKISEMIIAKNEEIQSLQAKIDAESKKQANKLTEELKATQDAFEKTHAERNAEITNMIAAQETALAAVTHTYTETKRVQEAEHAKAISEFEAQKQELEKQNTELQNARTAVIQELDQWLGLTHPEFLATVIEPAESLSQLYKIRGKNQPSTENLRDLAQTQILSDLNDSIEDFLLEHNDWEGIGLKVQVQAQANKFTPETGLIFRTKAYLAIKAVVQASVPFSEPVTKSAIIEYILNRYGWQQTTDGQESFAKLLESLEPQISLLLHKTVTERRPDVRSVLRSPQQEDPTQHLKLATNECHRALESGRKKLALINSRTEDEILGTPQKPSTIDLENSRAAVYE